MKYRTCGAHHEIINRILQDRPWLLEYVSMRLFNLVFGLLLCNVVAQSENYNVLSRTVVDQLQIQSDFSLPTKQVQLLDFRLVTGEGETIRCRGENFDTQEIRPCGTSQYSFSVNTVGNGPDTKTTCTIFYEICRLVDSMLRIEMLVSSIDL